MPKINAQQIRLAMQLGGLSQAKLALIADLEKRSVEKILQRGSCRSSTLLQVATALGVDPRTLLADSAEDGRAETFWNVPVELSPFFAGRRYFLEELQRSLNKLGRQVIRGLGGMGKTQAAVQYASQNRDLYNAVFWIRADKPTSVLSSVDSIADQLELCEPDAGAERKRTMFLEWLRRNPGWLIILDNVDELDPKYVQFLKPYIPELEIGHVLLTSRAKAFDMLGITSSPIRLPPLDTKTSTAFLLDRAGRDEREMKEASALAQELGGLPLALEQAGAYLCSIPSSIATYLDSFEVSKLAVLEKASPITGDYSHTVATTWLINFSKVRERSAAAADLLRLSAYANPDEIPFELIIEESRHMGPALHNEIANADTPSLAFAEVIGILERFSLVDVDFLNEFYSMHRMVQLVLKVHDEG